MAEVTSDDLAMARALSKRAARRFPTRDLYDDLVGASNLALVRRPDDVSPYFTILRAIQVEIKAQPGMTLKRGKGVSHIPYDSDFDEWAPALTWEDTRGVDWADWREGILQKLPPRDARVFGEMFGERECVDQKTAARRLGIPPATVSRSYQKTLGIIRSSYLEN